MIVAVIALFVALGGVAGAAATIVTTQMLQDNSVTRAKIAVNAVNSAKIEDGSIQSKDLSGNIRGQRGVAGPKGIPGARGATGPIGETGAPGPRGATGANGTNGVDGTNGISGVSVARVATPTPSWLGNYASSSGDLGEITFDAGNWLLIVTATTTSSLFGSPGGNPGVISCSLKVGSTALVTQSTSAPSRESSMALTIAMTKAVSPVMTTTYTTTCSAREMDGLTTTGLTYAAMRLDTIDS
jgi:hypothetical protein